MATSRSQVSVDIVTVVVDIKLVYIVIVHEASESRHQRSLYCDSGSRHQGSLYCDSGSRHQASLHGDS